MRNTSFFSFFRQSARRSVLLLWLAGTMALVGCGVSMGQRPAGAVDEQGNSVPTTQPVAWPVIEKLPLRLHTDSIQALRALSASNIPKEDIDRVQEYFHQKGEYPVANVAFNLDSSDVSRSSAQGYTMYFDYTANPDASLTITDWDDEGQFVYDTKSTVHTEMHYEYAFMSGDSNVITTKMHEFYGTQFRNSVSALLLKVDQERKQLEQLQYRYVGSRSQKPGAKPFVYVAYPQGGEEIADNSVSIMGYITSMNLTEDFQIFVNGKRQNVNRLWAVTPVEPKGLRGYPLRLNVPIGQGNNEIVMQVKDQKGFLVDHTVQVTGISFRDDAPAAAPVQMAGLPARLADVPVGGASSTQNVSQENFMAVIGDWVKDAAASDYNKGNRMFDDGRLERAAYYYKKSIQANPLPQAHFNLALVRKSQGDEGAAKDAFAEACRMGEQTACAL